MNALVHESIQAILDLLVGESAGSGIVVCGYEHAHDSAAFLTFAAGAYPIAVLVCGVTGSLKG
jgi:hypothetical protein